MPKCEEYVKKKRKNKYLFELSDMYYTNIIQV